MATVEKLTLPYSNEPEFSDPRAGQLFEAPLLEARGWLPGASQEATLLPTRVEETPVVMVIEESGSWVQPVVELDGAALPGGYVEPASKVVCRQLPAEAGGELALFIEERKVEERKAEPVEVKIPSSELEARHLKLRLSMLGHRRPSDTLER